MSIQRIYFVNVKDVTTEWIIPKNVNQQLLSNSIFNTQINKVEPILGSSLYDTICDAISKKESNGDPIPDYITNLMKYIQPYLIQEGSYDWVIYNHYKPTNKGVLRINDENSLNVSLDELNFFRDTLAKNAVYYKERLIKYLKENNLIPDDKSTDTGTILDTFGFVMDDNYIGGRSIGDTGHQFQEVDPIWESQKNNYYTKEEVDSLLVGGTSSTDLIYYTNLTPTPQTIGGIAAGSTFSNMSMQQMWDLLLYPYVAPTCTISVSGTPRELGSSVNTTINWSAIKKSKPIQTIYLIPPTGAAIGITATGNSQTGINTLTAIQNVNSNFSLQVSDGQTTVSDTKSVNWANKRYWGVVSPTHSLCFESTDTFTYTNLSELSYELIYPETYVQNRILTGVNKMVLFLWPTRIASNFDVNNDAYVQGFKNNNFTKTRNGIMFTNAQGYTEAYDVWCFNDPINASVTFDIRA